jgi:hypothetical protein
MVEEVKTQVIQKQDEDEFTITMPVPTKVLEVSQTEHPPKE